MTYTESEEREFSAQTSNVDLAAAARAAHEALEGKAERGSFTHQVAETFKVEITRGGHSAIVGYTAVATATYARIVRATMGPPSPISNDTDEYVEHDRRKAAELGMSVEEYTRGVEDR